MMLADYDGQRGEQAIVFRFDNLVALADPLNGTRFGLYFITWSFVNWNKYKYILPSMPLDGLRGNLITAMCGDVQTLAVTCSIIQQN